MREKLIGAGWRVTVPWLRGYRQETIVAGRGYDPETLGRDGLALLDAIGASSAVLVGHDWGALVAYVAATLAPERVRAIVTFGIPHPSLLSRTPAALWAGRHFIGLKLPGAARHCRRNDFAYLDELYRRWAPGWSGPERDQSVSRVKDALSSPTTLNGAIDYYRDLPLGGSPVLERPPVVPGLNRRRQRTISSPPSCSPPPPSCCRRRAGADCRARGPLATSRAGRRGRARAARVRARVWGVAGLGLRRR